MLTAAVGVLAVAGCTGLRRLRTQRLAQDVVGQAEALLRRARGLSGGAG